MKVYVCPICDHIMAGKHYCRNCHQFVKNPYYIDKSYSLDRDNAEADTKQYDKKELSPKKSKKQAEKKTKKRKYHIVWLIIIYIIFQIGMAVYAQIPKDFIGRIKEDVMRLFPEHEKEEKVKPEENSGLKIESGWNYQTPDYNEIIEQGEESTGLTHFAIQGEDFTDRIHQVLNDADFDVVESAEYMENYIAVNSEQSEEYSYFRNITTFYLTDNYMEYYRIAQDSVSGRLIDTEIESRDYDKVCFFVEAAAGLLIPDNKKKLKRTQKLNTSLERLLGEETYFSEEIGNLIVSGYTYTNREESIFHISLSGKENAKSAE